MCRTLVVQHRHRLSARARSGSSLADVDREVVDVVRHKATEEKSNTKKRVTQHRAAEQRLWKQVLSPQHHWNLHAQQPTLQHDYPHPASQRRFTFVQSRARSRSKQNAGATTPRQDKFASTRSVQTNRSRNTACSSCGSTSTRWMQKVHALAGMSGLERHEITLRHHEFWVYDPEGHQRSVHCTLEEREHNHRFVESSAVEEPSCDRR